APCPAEVELAELVRQRMPAVEMVRFVNSGTEATMAAVRLARAATQRDVILKFEGCYHGHADSFLVKAGSGVATLGLPDSPGVPAPLAELTLTVPFNDLSAVEALFGLRGKEIAAVIVEPYVGNAGFIPPEPGFHPALRAVCDRYGSLLIFDEVMAGFRVGPGGAQQRLGVRPDLTTLGKIIGGGMPVGAYGGRADLMRMVAPEGPVYQAGTLSGNPVAMAAGLATLRETERSGFYDTLEQRTARLVAGIGDAARRHGVPASGGHAGGRRGAVRHRRGDRGAARLHPGRRVLDRCPGYGRPARRPARRLPERASRGYLRRERHGKPLRDGGRPPLPRPCQRCAGRLRADPPAPGAGGELPRGRAGR